MRFFVVTCTRGSSACHLCKCNKNLRCKQVAVTACTTRGLCLSVLQLKANFNGECKCPALHERPVASSICPVPIPKRTCSGCGTIQAMGSLCPTKSMQVSVLSAPNSTKNLQLMWVAITSYTIQALSPVCQFFNLKKTSIVNVSVIASTTRGFSALLSTTQVAVIACTPRGCTTRGSYACLLCNSKNTCSASRLLSTGCCGTASMTRELCLTVLQ